MISRTGEHDRLSIGQVVAFAIAATVPVYYALRGGSYDIVVRQEEAIVVWLVVGLGFALGLLPLARPSRATAIPLLAVALLAIWTAIGSSWTESDERTLAEVARVVHFGGLALLAFSVVDRRNWRAAAAGLGAAGVFVTLLALASRLAPEAFPTNEIKRSFNSNRVNYPFHYWNAVAAWGVMTMAMALSWSASARRVAVRAASLAIVPACGLTVYLTYSRAGAIGTGLAALIVLVLAQRRWLAFVHIVAAAGGAAVAILVARGHEQIVEATGSAGAGATVAVLLATGAVAGLVAVVTARVGLERWRLPAPAGRIFVGAGAVLLIAIALTAARDPVSNAWDDFRGKDEPTAQERLAHQRKDPASRLTNLSGTRYFEWRSALRAFKSEPLEGIGAGTFEYWWNRDDGREFVRDAHSLYFESLGELGIPGLMLVVAFVLGLLAVALRARWREAAVAAPAAALAVYLFHAGLDWMWETTAVTALAILCAAAAAGAASSPLGRPWLPARVGVPVIAVVAILVQLPGLVSTSAVRSSQSAAKRGDLTAAAADAQDAVEAEPWAATPYIQRALLAESDGRLRAAAVDLRHATDREPTNWRPWLLLARVEAERGRVRAGLADFRKARRLRPDSQFFLPPSSR